MTSRGGSGRGTSGGVKLGGSWVRLQPTVLCAAAKQVEDVAMSPDDLHHFHLLYQVGKFSVRSVVCDTHNDVLDSIIWQTLNVIVGGANYRVEN